MGEDVGHTIEDRRKNAHRLTNLCKFLDSHGINVIACVLSLFHDNQKFNRETFSQYREVYLNVVMEKLIQRDKKNLYKDALEGKIKNVVGIDINFKPPLAPDLVIDNNKDCPNFDLIVEKIIRGLCLDKK